MAIAPLTTQPTASPLPALPRRGQHPTMPAAAVPISIRTEPHGGKRSMVHGPVPASSPVLSSAAELQGALRRLNPLRHFSVPAAGTAVFQAAAHTGQCRAESLDLGAASLEPPKAWHQATDAVPASLFQTGLQPFLKSPAPAVRVLRRPENLLRPGRLVIAGRMEDVCAELDRLVAMEDLH